MMLIHINHYHAVLTHIQLLWELILLNEPIAILGSFPTYCSQTVQALGKLFSLISLNNLDR